ncbi:MAG: MarR family winged helix-turn-helix transcriptional regulator [Pseudomonadota bacterium]
MKHARTGKGQKRSDLETSSWFAVVRAYEECARRYARMLEHFELTTSQFDALVAIEHLGLAAMPKSIAEHLLVTRPNVTGLLRRLEERELIRMTPHASDGRALLCGLTPTGRRCVRSARRAAERFVRAQAAPFSNGELQSLEDLMRGMYRHLKTMDPDILAQGEAEARPCDDQGIGNKGRVAAGVGGRSGS